jgi:diaphanous 2
MNNTDGLRMFLKYDVGHEIVAKCLDHRNQPVMIQALKILAALCFLDDHAGCSGTDKMLVAITKVHEANDVPRFLPIVNAITKCADNADLQSMCFQFINALLSQTDDFEFRMHLRNEIVRNGLYDTLGEFEDPEEGTRVIFYDVSSRTEKRDESRDQESV